MRQMKKERKSGVVSWRVCDTCDTSMLYDISMYTWGVPPQHDIPSVNFVKLVKSFWYTGCAEPKCLVSWRALVAVF